MFLTPIGSGPRVKQRKVMPLSGKKFYPLSKGTLHIRPAEREGDMKLTLLCCKDRVIINTLLRGF